MITQNKLNGTWQTVRLASSLMAGLLTMSLISGCTTGEPLVESLPELLRHPSGSQSVVREADDASPASHIQETQHPGLITLQATDNLMTIVDQTRGNVVLDFYADWCGPCRSQAKILQELKSTAVKYDSLIVKINVDHHPELAQQFQIRSLPTLVLVQEGNIAQRRTGLSDRSIVSEFLTR